LKRRSSQTGGKQVKKARFALALLLAVVMVLGCVPVAFAKGSFSDVADDHWAAQRISRMVDDGIIKGYDDGTFRPEEVVTREEFAALVVRALGLTLVNPAAPTFSDVPKTAWSYMEVETAAKQGYIKGYGGGLFGPQDLIKRADLALMLIRVLGLEGEAGSISSPCVLANDEVQIPDYAIGAMTLAYRAGVQLLTYRWGRLCAPNASATRAEAAYAIYGTKYRPTATQITFRRDMDPTGFCALFTQLGATATSYGYMVEPFVGMDLGADGSPVFYPRLIKRIPSVENGLWKMLSGGRMELTYELRENLYWNDGIPVTTADVEFALKAFMNTKVPILNRAPYEKIEKLEIVDPHVFKITWKEPYPYAWLINNSVQGYCGLVSLPKHFFETAYDQAVKDGDWVKFQDYVSTNPVLPGPYRLKEYKPGQEVVFEPNPYYYMGAPNASKLVMKIVPDSASFMAMILNGSIDYGGIYMDLALQLDRQKPSGLALAYSMSQNSVLYIGGNYNDPKDLSKPHPVLADPKVRQAFLYAIDRDTINQVVFGGKHQVADAWIASPRHPLYTAGAAIHYEYDPAKANALLDELGWEMGSDGVRVKDGVRLSVENVTPAGSTGLEQVQMMVRDYLKQVGIEYKPNNMPWSAFSANFRRYRKFDTMMGDWGWNIFSEADAYYYSSVIPSEANSWGGLNYYGWQNAESDELVREASVTVDPAKRKELYAEHLRIFSEDLPIMPLLVYQNATFYREKLAEFKMPGFEPGTTENAYRWYKER